MIFIDTHVALWIFEQNDQMLSATVKDLLEKAAGNIYVSPMVILELEYLHEKKRINHNVNSMLTDLESRISLKTSSKAIKEIITSARNIRWRRDVFDRIIVAEEKLNDANLITKDRLIRDNYDKAIW